jgi:hypothetical protein
MCYSLDVEVFEPCILLPLLCFLPRRLLIKRKFLEICEQKRFLHIYITLDVNVFEPCILLPFEIANTNLMNNFSSLVDKNRYLKY